jgi:hypothetical protein
MQTRYRAAATSLLLTATAGLAATGGAAEASGTHHTSARAAQLTVTITTSRKGLDLSTSRIRPGRTTFKVVRPHKSGKGLIEVLRLRKGYSFADASKDFGGLFSGDVAAVRRIDKNIVFYGGMPSPLLGAGPTKWAVDIDKAGNYIVANLDKQKVTMLKARGTHQNRPWPAADGKLNIARGNVWKPGSNNANHGWMNTTNKAREPHFVELSHLKKNTTEDNWQSFINTGHPNVLAKDGSSAGTGVISPGHSFRWKFAVHKGTYGSACFWPSKVDGTPHAIMGMTAVFSLS